MLSLFKNNNPVTIGILLVVTIVLQLQAVLHGVLPQADDSQILYVFILQLLGTVFGKHPLPYHLLGVLLLMLQVLYLNSIARRHRIYEEQSYLPAITFVFLSSLSPTFAVFNAHLFVNFCLLYMIDTLLAVKVLYDANKQLFNVSFVMMLAVLLQFSSIVYLVFLICAIFVYRPPNFKELIVLLFGFAMPLYILGATLFCVDQWGLFHDWANLGVSLPRELKYPVYYLGVSIGVLLWGAISIFNMQTILGRSSVAYRRDWALLTILLFVCVIASVFSDSAVQGAWLMPIPVLSLIMTFAFSGYRNAKMNTISFYFALLLVIFIQWNMPL